MVAAVQADRCALAREVAGIHWYHSIDLGGGIVTPGEFTNEATLAVLGLPDRLDGKRVLDVGALDGFYSFEAERRGAAHVLAVDLPQGRDDVAAGPQGFELAHRVLGSHVERLDADLLDLVPARVGVFDVVLMLGVLYHLRHPLLGLERLRALTRELLIVETHLDMPGIRRPAAAFYPGSELRGDPHNWWGPNAGAVEAMLRAAGFAQTRRVHRDGAGRRIGRAWGRARRFGPRAGLASVRHSRAVFHARP